MTLEPPPSSAGSPTPQRAEPAGDRAALPAMDRVARLQRLRAALDDQSCDALIVTKPVNIRWLIGFTGSNGTVVVTPDRLTVVTDGRYRTQIDDQLQASGLDRPDLHLDVVIERDIEKPVVASLESSVSVGLESEHVTWSLQRRFAQWLDREPVATDGLIEGLRQVKDEAEIARLRMAAGIADRAVELVAPQLGAGPTEREVARLLDTTMGRDGSDEPSFATIVASGPNSALPHAVPGDRVIEPGDLVVIDCGAKVDGYGSDMTRTFAVGRFTDEQRDLYNAVDRAQRAGVAAVRSGVEEREVDDVCRRSLDEDGLGDAFVHGTGHGIGLEIHENPILSTRATGILRSGLVVTVEPGAYLPGFGGVRIEDSVVVTDEGSITMTNAVKDPVVAVG